MNAAISTTQQFKKSTLGSRFRRAVGALMERVNAPAQIKEFEYIDHQTNETVYLSTGARYSVLHVGSKRLFFDRITGQFDGTGTLLQERIVDRLQLLD